MEKYARLLAFLCELIDIQIKKYVSLTRIGIGPDARMNAKLVLDEVGALFLFADQLLSELEHPSQSEQSGKQFETIFNQIKFYFEQEYIRAYAGWLIDENNIHSPEYHRLAQQSDKLQELASDAKISLGAFSPPQTPAQRQCQHDSHEIAYFILDLVVQLKQNPAMELDENTLPVHARKIMLSHIAEPDSRYNKESIWNPIQQLHERCRLFLEQSTLQKSIEKLSRDAANANASKHIDALKDILARFQKVQPDSAIFASTHQWYDIGRESPAVSKEKQTKKSTSYKHFVLFGSVAAAAMASLIYYVTQAQDDTVLNVAKI
jgi:hypothetical protein